MTYKVTYSTIDRFRKTRIFKTMKAAKAYAVKWIGERPEMGSCYAISHDGIGKIMCEGCTTRELFAYGVPDAERELTDAEMAVALYGDGLPTFYNGERVWNTKEDDAAHAAACAAEMARWRSLTV